MQKKLISVPCRGTTFLNIDDGVVLDDSEHQNFRPLSGNYISQFLKEMFNGE